MNYFIFLLFPWGEILWAFIWGAPLLAIARFDAIRRKREPLKLFDECSYEILSAMLVLGLYLKVIIAYSPPSKEIPDIGVTGFDLIAVAILLGLYLWCLFSIYRANRSRKWKAIMVVLVSTLMFVFAPWLAVPTIDSTWGWRRGRTGSHPRPCETPGGLLRLRFASPPGQQVVRATEDGRFILECCSFRAANRKRHLNEGDQVTNARHRCIHDEFEARATILRPRCYACLRVTPLSVIWRPRRRGIGAA